MTSIDQLKKDWSAAHGSTTGAYDPATFSRIVRSRVKAHTQTAMQYFWAAFVMQIIVYALLCNVIVRYWSNPGILIPAIWGVMLFIPFTTVLMIKFKAIAVARPDRHQEGQIGDTSLKDYITVRRNLLMSFYRFKKWYEFILIPTASAIGVFIVFELYVPGGVIEHQSGAIIIFIVTVLSCALAIRKENQKNFREPLMRFNEVLAEFEGEERQNDSL